MSYAHLKGKDDVTLSSRSHRGDLARDIDEYADTRYFHHESGTESLDESSRKDRADVIASFFAKHGFEGKLNKYVPYAQIFDTGITKSAEWDALKSQEGENVYEWLRKNNATKAR